MRYDLAFFLCCCKSFLGNNSRVDDEDDFYHLLGVDPSASLDEIKRAYKRRSLEMHPDKLAQRGKAITEKDQARFTRMKEAYECLQDPHKRETYDAIGEQGMKWMDEPFSMDPQELVHNFTNSSVLDRSKIFGIVVGFFAIIFLLPILVCLHVDGTFGADASWVKTFIPLWIWNVLGFWYHWQVITMRPPQSDENDQDTEWVDPRLPPMKERIHSFVSFFLWVVFEVLLAMKLDDNIQGCPWGVVFLPLFLWETKTFVKTWPLINVQIVTIQDLEDRLGKPVAEWSAEETTTLYATYKVVDSEAEFDEAKGQQADAKKGLIKSFLRMLFLVFVVIQLDLFSQEEDNDAWYNNWWLLFSPVWIMIFLACAVDYLTFAKVQVTVVERHPDLFSPFLDEQNEDAEMGMANKSGETDAMNERTSSNNDYGNNTDTVSSTTNYGSVGMDGAATREEAAKKSPKLTEEEAEKLRQEVLNSGSQFCTKCCGQFGLLILVCLFVSKLQGASFSSFWIISPFLFAAGIILCCVGCAIFGATELDEADFYASSDAPNNFVDLQEEPLSAPSTRIATEGQIVSEQLIEAPQQTQEDETEIRELD